MDYYVKGAGPKPADAAGGVDILTSKCPAATPDGTTYLAVLLSSDTNAILAVGPDGHTVTARAELPGAGFVAFAGRWALGGADILALVAITAAALPDLETAGLAEIVAPGIGRRAVALVALAVGLRTHEGGRLFEGETDLRIGHRIRMAGLVAIAGVRDDVAARPISEIRRPR